MDRFYSGPSIKSYKKLSDWFDFKKDNMILVNSGKIDIGQHISSSIALICSKITGVHYNQIEIVRLNTSFTPNEGKTASSLSIPHSGSAIKAASFTLRKNFLKYVVEKLHITQDEMNFENGIVTHKSSNKSFSYWDFSRTKEFLNIEIPENFDEKVLKEFKYQNRQKIEVKTINEIVTGKYKYVHDLTFPNMLHARIVRPPNYYNKFIDIDQKVLKTLKKMNIKLFIKGSFVAILSSEEFLVVKYLTIVKNSIHWQNIKDLTDGNGNIYNLLLNNQRDKLNVRSGGEAFKEDIPKLKDIKEKGSKTLNSIYKKSYLMHAPLAPSAACAIFKNKKFEIYD